jgi:Phage-related lysozyme (muraminidase)
MPEITPRVVAYLASEEGICDEAYLDTGKIWTWALGVTNASGHQVYPRYKDNPQSLDKCFAVSIWLIRNRYLPAVVESLPQNATEAQLAAALSFHWNSGKFPLYSKDFSKAVEIRNKGLLDDRRLREQKLYYEGTWPSLKCSVYPVSHKTYNPMFSKATRIDPLPFIQKAWTE